MDRRSFLKVLGLGMTATAAGVLVPEPVRRFWQVPRNAPVGPRLDMFTERDASGLARLQVIAEGEPFAADTAPSIDDLVRTVFEHGGYPCDVTFELEGAISRRVRDKMLGQPLLSPSSQPIGVIAGFTPEGLAIVRMTGPTLSLRGSIEV